MSDELINVTDVTDNYDNCSSDDSSDSSDSRTKKTKSKFGKSSRKKASQKCLTDGELHELRLKVNSRERRRMHDLNSALDGLREVMPYANGPSVRKLSKISTLLLAKNYILMLSNSLEEMKKLVSDVYRNRPANTLPSGLNLASSGLGAGALTQSAVHTAAVTPALPPVTQATVLPPVPVHPAALTHSATTIHRPLVYGNWTLPCACPQCIDPITRATNAHQSYSSTILSTSAPHTYSSTILSTSTTQH